MKPICIIPLVGIMIMTALSFSVSGNQKIKDRLTIELGFAVVELFTSEGCSSCPPADELAITLSKEYRGNVYFLGYHVDYWDYVGWKDKFSQPEHTKLQTQYATAFNLNSIYTPQAVINGKKEFVGSDQRLLRQAIIAELKIKPSADIQLAAERNKDSISASYTTLVSANQILKIALVQVHAETVVKKGENKDRKLNHINVVREVQNIAIDKKGYGKVNFKIPGDLNTHNMKLIAFIQNKGDLKIMAATHAIIQ